MTDPSTVRPSGINDCGCNEFGSEDLECDARGKCNCKCDVCGDKCDECCIGYYGLAFQDPDNPKETFLDHCHGNSI